MRALRSPKEKSWWMSHLDEVLGREAEQIVLVFYQPIQVQAQFAQANTDRIDIVHRHRADGETRNPAPRASVQQLGSPRPNPPPGALCVSTSCAAVDARLTGNPSKCEKDGRLWGSRITLPQEFLVWFS